MKKWRLIIMTSLVLGLTHHLQAQGINEWVRQKQTQTQYLLQQVAVLQVYIGQLKKGYDIVRKGISTVRNIKDGEFRLHDVYYTSLRTVNPRLRKLPQAEAILHNHQYILAMTADVLAFLRENGHFAPDEQTRLKTICQNLSADVETNTSELLALLSDGEWQMTDDQRIQRIQALYAYSVRQRVFIKSLGSDIYSLAAGREQETRDDRQLKTLYDIK